MVRGQATTRSVSPLHSPEQKWRSEYLKVMCSGIRRGGYPPYLARLASRRKTAVKKRLAALSFLSTAAQQKPPACGGFCWVFIALLYRAHDRVPALLLFTPTTAHPTQGPDRRQSDAKDAQRARFWHVGADGIEGRTLSWRNYLVQFRHCKLAV